MVYSEKIYYQFVTTFSYIFVQSSLSNKFLIWHKHGKCHITWFKNNTHAKVYFIGLIYTRLCNYFANKTSDVIKLLNSKFSR